MHRGPDTQTSYNKLLVLFNNPLRLPSFASLGMFDARVQTYFVSTLYAVVTGQAYASQWPRMAYCPWPFHNTSSRSRPTTGSLHGLREVQQPQQGRRSSKLGWSERLFPHIPKKGTQAVPASLAVQGDEHALPSKLRQQGVWFSAPARACLSALRCRPQLLHGLKINCQPF